MIRKFVFGLGITLGATALMALRASACPDTIFRSCNCPRGCAQSSCESACVLVAVDYDFNGHETCTRRCDPCQCYSYGKSNSGRCGSLLGMLEFFVADAAADEAAGIHLQKGDKMYSNPDGDFLVTETASSDDEPVGTIGVRIIKSSKGLEIAGILDGTPAAKARMAEGDIVVSIDGRSASGMSLEQAVKALRGKPGTLVVLRVKNKAQGKTAKVSLVRVAASAPRQGIGVGIKKVQLKDLKSDACPKMSDGCNFLYEEKGSCAYTCKKDQGK